MSITALGAERAIIFISDAHEKFYYEKLKEVRCQDVYHKKLHQNYLKRKANGKQKAYEERTKAEKKAKIDTQKEAIRAEDREKGIYYIVSDKGVPKIPRAKDTAIV